MYVPGGPGTSTATNVFKEEPLLEEGSSLNESSGLDLTGGEDSSNFFKLTPLASQNVTQKTLIYAHP